jgi:hypothetical protein
MTITPDTKDWTWVLEKRCADCGLDASTVEPQAVGQMLRDVAGTFVVVLEGEGVRDRPSPEVWSPLEYSCHVRDVFRIFDGRLQRMLTEDDPLFANWDQDATAVEERYGEQDPAQVAAELSAAAEAIATSFESVGDDQWERPGRRSDGANFTIASFARYLLHDPVHHRWDVTGERSN